MYVENYENISDLKAAIISAIQEVSDGMVTLTIKSSVDSYKWSFGIREGILKNKVAMCLYVVCIKILMSEHFKHKLMNIEQIELELLKF